MTDRPAALIPEFADSGADLITVHAEVGRSEAEAAMEAIVRADCSAGLALCLDTPVAAAEPYLDRIDTLLLLGTALGVKGQDLPPEACARLAAAGSTLGRRRAHVRLIADGGIRSDTVPLLRQATPTSSCLDPWYASRRTCPRLSHGCARFRLGLPLDAAHQDRVRAGCRRR